MTDKTAVPPFSTAEIISMAREAEMMNTPLHQISALVTLVAERAAAAEREACAQVCDEIERVKWTSAGAGRRMPGPIRCAIAIRARGEA